MTGLAKLWEAGRAVDGTALSQTRSGKLFTTVRAAAAKADVRGSSPRRAANRPDARVVRERSAKAPTPVQFRLWSPSSSGFEAGMISAHTKAALAAAKRRGVKLGGDRGARLTAKARAAGRATLQERARSRAVDLAPTIKELQAAGCESLRAILRRAWRSAAFLRHAAASGLLSRCPDCWRRPALSAEAPPSPSRES